MKRTTIAGGKLMPIGDNEVSVPEEAQKAITSSGTTAFVFEPWKRGKGTPCRIGVVATAMNEPEEIANMCLKAFEKLSCKDGPYIEP